MQQLQSFVLFALLAIVVLVTIANILTHYTDFGKRISVDKFRYDIKAVSNPVKRRAISNYPINEVIDTIQYKCLSTDDADQLISRFPQVFLMSPIGGAEFQFKKFADQCIPPGSAPIHFEPFTTENHAIFDPYVVPPLIAGHVFRGRSFIPEIEQSSRTNLLVYSHQEDKAKLKSSIKHIVKVRLFKPFKDPDYKSKFKQLYDEMLEVKEKSGHNMSFNETHDLIEEGLLVYIIKSQMKEISQSNGKILSCEVYKSIQTSRPNLIFSNYKRSHDVEQLLAKKYCPNLPIESYVPEEKDPILVIGNDNSEHYLDDWIDTKIELLQWSLGLREVGGCDGETRVMEKAMSSCPSEMLQAVGFGRVM